MVNEQSIWETETYYAQQDFIIVGGGLVGLWCAYELKIKFSKAKITIVEKGLVPSGASTRNAGFACFGSPTEMIADKPKMGEEKMWSTVAMRYNGIEKIRKTFGDKMIGFDMCGGFECLNEQKATEVNAHLGWLNKGLKVITGSNQTFSWSNHKLDTFGFAGFDCLIENELEGGLHSGKLVQALTIKVQSLGVTVLTGIEVTNTIVEGNYQTIETNRGVSFNTRQVIYCTNAFTNKLVNDDFVTPARGQILVTDPIEGLKMKGTFHYDEGYYYFRNLDNRILIGGARNKDFKTEEITTFETTPIIQQELERFIQTHLLPYTPYTISHRWSGIMGFTENKEPAIKKIHENSIAVIACNGMGVALSPIIAEDVAKLF